MSHRLISRNPDLRRLRDEGYNLEIKAGHLVLRDVPYVNAKKVVKYDGILVSVLAFKGDDTIKPNTHVAFFCGEHPCNENGEEIKQIKHNSRRQDLGEGLIVDHSFSAKVKGNYTDFYQKMTTYIKLLSGPAQAIDGDADARTFPTYEAREDESVFKFLDTASSRAGIGAVNQKLAVDKVAIVGLGGTGSYVFDFLAKTPIKELHLFDKDDFSSHNAFRSPGAASLDDLSAGQTKVHYLKAQYSKMRRNIFEHECYIDASNVEKLNDMNFVFLCLDKAKPKKAIVEALEGFGIPFIDVGMGVQLVESSLVGQLRTTVSTPTKRDHVRENNRISFSNGDYNDDYDQNIQIAELNALNAAIAVIKWKKLCGFYGDVDREHNSVYVIDENVIVNEDKL